MAGNEDGESTENGDEEIAGNMDEESAENVGEEIAGTVDEEPAENGDKRSGEWPSIRPARSTDAPTVHDLARRSWHAAYDEFLGEETVDETIDEWYVVDRLEASIADAGERDGAVFLVAESSRGDTGSSRNLVGFVHVVPWSEDPAVALLARLYVHPRRWGDGIGTALLEEAVDVTGEHFDRLRLTVLADNDVGVAFYESRGFERVATHQSDLDDDLEEAVYEKVT